MSLAPLARLGTALGIALSLPCSPTRGDEAIDYIEKLTSEVAFRPAFPETKRFTQPVWCLPLPGDENQRVVVLEHQTAKAWLGRLDAPDSEKTLFADWGETVSDGPWEGLMCLAFHPRYQENRRFFLKHESLIDGQRHTMVVERRATPDLQADSGEPPKTLLAIRQPADNHNGGTLAFGPDGFLYVGMGDGGPQEDPKGYTQNGASLLGKMLRIDVDQTTNGLPYGIPKDNPFLDRTELGWRPEIWALGLREPWRFSFDRFSGDLWVGDVGQLKYEEILILRRGENHGWNVREGHAPFKSTRLRTGEVYTEPLIAYGRQLGASVTGGYVYRGRKRPDWHGVYLFADFNTRRVFGARLCPKGRVAALLELGTAPEAPASFAETVDGELLLVGYGGMLFHLDFPEAPFPEHQATANGTWEQSLAHTREAAEGVMGPFPPGERRVSLDLETLQEVDMGTYLRRLITYQSEPGSRVPAYLCLPKSVLSGEASAAPAVLCLHPTDMKVGHQVVVGLGGRAGRQYAAELAERGCVTLSPAYPHLANYWPNLGALGYVSGTMKAIWDNSRALDLLESLPFVKHGEGFAAIGHSLGGHNALFTALFDERLQAVVTSCGFDAFEDYYEGNRENWNFGKGWCQIRYMPRLSNYRGRLHEIPFNFDDLLNAIAPRRVFVNAPRGDGNFRWESVRRLTQTALNVDARFQLNDRLIVRHPDTGHEFPEALRHEAYAFIESVIGTPKRGDE